MTHRELTENTRRWLSRLIAVAMATAVVLLAQTQSASGDGGSGSLGQTPPALAWIKLTDTHGISIWNYEMSLDRGGVTDPGKFFWSSVVDTYWGSYRSGCALALWFLDWVMSYDWLHVIASPLLSTGDAMQSVVSRIGVVPTLLTVAAIVAVGWMAKGRYATGIWELAMSLMIATLASGVFAQPVQLVAGPDGLIMKAQHVGLELAGELSAQQGGGSSDPDQIRAQMTGQMVDTFVREPAQMINFGQILDGGKCQKAYDDVVSKGPYGDDDDIRDKVNGCDSKLGDYADSPSAGMATGALMFEPASGIILLLVIVLAGSVIAAACYAMFQSLKAIVSLVTALLPGGSRGSLFMTVAETAISLLIIVFTNVFLCMFLLVIQALFKDSAGSSKPRTFVILDVLLIVGIGVYWRYRRRLKESAQRLAQWMSQRPGGGSATRLPERSGGASVAGKALTIASQLSMLRARRVNQGGVGGFDEGSEDGCYGEDDGRGDGGGESPPTGDSPTPRSPRAGAPSSGSPLARVAARKSSLGRALVGTLARAGTKAALAAATGGGSTAVTGALRATKVGRALRTARRATLVGRLAASGGRSNTSAEPAAAPARPSAQPRPARPLPTTPTQSVPPVVVPDPPPTASRRPEPSRPPSGIGTPTRAPIVPASAAGEALARRLGTDRPRRRAGPPPRDPSRERPDGPPLPILQSNQTRRDELLGPAPPRQPPPRLPMTSTPTTEEPPAVRRPRRPGNDQ